MKYVIFAPHVDDEVVGCYRLLEKRLVSHVFYFFEHKDPVRHAEALNCAQTFKFIPHFVSVDTEFKVPANRIFLLPSIRDNHPHHKQVNAYGRSRFSNHQKQFYSVDMVGRFDVLDQQSRFAKKDALRTLFPSQATLFDRDDKYHLFEMLALSDLEKTIHVSTRFEGVHCYPDAPEGVEFLRYPHRHVFHVEIDLEVFHDDRDVEFILFKREIDALIQASPSDLQHKSCEMVASFLLEYVVGKYPGRKCSVDVSEDGENGARLAFNY